MPQPKSRKIAVLGYRSVGKSSLTIQFVEGQFVDSYDPTIENTFTKMMTVNGQEYNLQLVDTAGQDEYSIFPQSYTIDVDGYILIYSVTSYKSFEVVRVIHEKLLDMVGNVQYVHTSHTCTHTHTHTHITYMHTHTHTSRTSHTDGVVPHSSRSVSVVVKRAKKRDKRETEPRRNGVSIPYVSGLSEKLQRIFRQHDVPVFFKP
ncbi:GTP-binding protein Rheb-like, partial [Siniperca chuatsi]|uniref:GTP-binding protein Rheb-like n=1 Tax=Siniperca chuatsi TaxID=119488 RepID=UPI001CE0414B